MSFNIDFLDDPVPSSKLSPGEVATFAKITIGDFSERMVVPLNYWSRSDYHRQWVGAIKRLLEAEENTPVALITEMYDPVKPAFALMWWPLYRRADKVYIRNGFLPFDQVPHPFSLDTAYNLILPRDTTSRSGETISEWVTTVAELEEWATSLEAKAEVGRGRTS